MIARDENRERTYGKKIMRVWELLVVIQTCVVLACANFSVDGFLGAFEGVQSYEVVYPRLVGHRHLPGSSRWRRDLGRDDDGDMRLVSLKDWLLELRPNADLEIAPRAEWHSKDGRSYSELPPACRLQVGRVQGVGPDSLVAITEADGGMTGLVQVGGAAFFLRPLAAPRGKESPPPHALYRVVAPVDLSDDQQAPRRRSRRESYWSHNLTVARTPGERRPSALDEVWRRRGPDQQQEEEVGYFVDAVWERDNMPQKNLVTPVTYSSPRWLELSLAVDHSVIQFHGADRVQHYVIALLNIVSAIYKDSSLNSNMKLVIVRMIFYQDEAHSQIVEGNSKKSLENVNAWNRRLLSGLAPSERHDVAVWLTRLDLGGPSGYAPVSGACDPGRSCTLNRDEGLTSAFIIAHEVAHVLGLSHDGDKAAGNDCGQEAMMGSVMAPMVAATFHRFSWSRCSYTEFHSKTVRWKCLMNPPRSMNATHLNSTLQATYSMDEQCRLEFGDGYALCRIFELPEPCSHLWCGHTASDVCKTKKGPPLEGTQCGVDRWCVNGYCELVDPGRFRLGQEPVVHNPRHGGWGDWQDWGACSRSCGRGVRFRTRRCDNPRPEYGGDDCSGRSEEFQVCGVRSCPEPLRDFRAEQCRRLPKLMPQGYSRWLNHTWLPHEPTEASSKCQLVCVSKETGQVFATGENVVDGTRCSYEDDGADMCIQVDFISGEFTANPMPLVAPICEIRLLVCKGDCQRMGCDGVLDSTVTEDWCGVCGGNGTRCTNITTTFHRKLRRCITRVSVLPRLARNIRLKVDTVLGHGTVSVLLRDRRRGKQYSFFPASTDDTHDDDDDPSLRVGEDEMSSTLVVEGARFHYSKLGSRQTLRAVGPILGELVLSVVVSDPDGAKVSSVSHYTLASDDPGAAGQRYVWVEGGWGPCSRSCGGGRRQRTAACRDTSTGRLTSRGRCSLLAKPRPRVDKCNMFSCDFHWHPGAWEHCSATCGSRGEQFREVFCVHGDANSTAAEHGEPWRNSVDPRWCVPGLLKPATSRRCNQEPCPAHWAPGQWSQCSATCGVGVETREFRCPAPRGEPLFDCGPSPPDERRTCRGRHRHRDPLCQPSPEACRRDASKYCSLTALLGRYCVIPGYRRLCCKTCRQLLE